MQSLQSIEIGQLHESKHNPRRHVDAAALAELADSIAQVGILTPLLVRPNAKGFEIAAGHRRYRAAKLAKLDEVPCLVRAFSDAEFMEILTIDNLQREDVHALDEAKGYEALMAAPYKLGVQTIADKVGRSVKYIYDRVKLLTLIPEGQELFWDGKITAGHAILLARLGPTDQKRCIDESHGLMRGEQSLYATDEEKTNKGKYDGLVAVSVRELEDWIKRHVRFDVKTPDRMLFPETAQALTQAVEEDRKVVEITHEYLASDDVRGAAPQKVYGERGWRRADGKAGSKVCDYAVLGVIAAGQDRGAAFDVCTRKDKCLVHWSTEIKAREKRAKDAGTPTAAKAEAQRAAQQTKQDQKYRRREARRKTWDQHEGKIVAAVIERVKKLDAKPTGVLASRIVQRVVDRGAKMPGISRGTTHEDLIRYLAAALLYDQVTEWGAYDEFPKTAKLLGIDLSKILPAEPSAAPAKKGKK